MILNRDQYSDRSTNLGVKSYSWEIITPTLSFPLLSSLEVCKATTGLFLQCTVNFLHEPVKAEKAVNVDWRQ